MSNLVDQYVWNDQTEVVDHLFPELETQYPDIDRWYEVRQGHDVFAASAGVVTVRLMSHMWFGCPADKTIEQAIQELFT